MPPPTAPKLTTLDRLAVERFRGDVEAATGSVPSTDQRLGLAVSGGPDSVALLVLAHAAYPGSIAVATVDHGLRPESANEAASVASICAGLGVPHSILVKPPAFEFTGNLQEQARTLRYTVLRFWGGSDTFRNARPWRVEWIATAHQQDDVAETFLMRARRGSGLRGLAAMPARRDVLYQFGPPIIRPLLGWSRAELGAIASASALPLVVDPSNEHPRFDRSRIRQLLAQSAELPPERLALAAINLRHAEEAIAWMVEREWAARSEIEAHETVWLDPAGLPYELRRRLVERAIEHLHFEFGMTGLWRGTGVDRMVVALDGGKHPTLAGIAARSGKRWRFRGAPPRRAS